eukprot:Sdes_comp20833_c0_seq1m17443
MRGGRKKQKRGIGTDRFVLPGDEIPQANVIYGKVEKFGDLEVEIRKGDCFEDFDGFDGGICDWIPFEEIKSVMVSERVFRGNHDGGVEMHFFKFAVFSGFFGFFALESIDQMFGDVLMGDWTENIMEGTFTNVDQHVRICVFSIQLCQIESRKSSEGPVWAFRLIDAEIFLKRLFGGDFHHSIIVVFVPFLFAIRTQENHIMAAVDITAVNQNCVQNIVGRIGGIWSFEEFIELDSFAELVTIVHFDHHIAIHVVFESFELELKHGGELLENDTHFGVLEAVAFCVIFVVSVQIFDLDIVAERFHDVLHAFDVQLNIVEGFDPT